MEGKDKKGRTSLRSLGFNPTRRAGHWGCCGGGCCWRSGGRYGRGGIGGWSGFLLVGLLLLLLTLLAAEETTETAFDLGESIGS